MSRSGPIRKFAPSGSAPARHERDSRERVIGVRAPAALPGALKKPIARAVEPGPLVSPKKPCAHAHTLNTLSRTVQRIGENGAALARRRFQKGSLYFNEGKNRWEARWREDVLGPDNQVRRVQKKTIIGTRDEFPTKPRAARQLDQLLQRVNAFDYKPGRIATIAAFAEEWTEGALPLQAPSSARAARSHLRTWIKPLLGHLRWEAVTQRVVQEFVNRLAKKVSRKSVLNIVNTLAAMLRDARSWDYAAPVLRFRELRYPADAERRQRPTYTAQHVRDILERAKDPWRTLYVLLAMTGLRPGEGLGMKWCDLDFDRSLLHVNRSAWYGICKAPKTRTGRRTVPMPAALRTWLLSYRQRWQANRDGFLFATRNGRPPSTNKVQNDRLRPILEKLKIYQPTMGLYSFRHALATLLLESGASPKTTAAQLGHSDPRVTLEIYTRVVPQHHAAAIERVACELFPANCSLVTEAAEPQPQTTMLQ